MNQLPVIIGIAIALSMDALAVSAANGAMISHIKFKQALRIAFFFGFFQAFMPLIGFLVGLTVRRYILQVDHWVVFGLLLFIGGRMLVQSFTGPAEKVNNCLHPPTLLLMSVATSIDALAVGLSLAALNTPIWLPVLIIGVITFLFSMAGIRMGKWVGPFFGRWAERLGGIVLIGIGIKILAEHLLRHI